MRTKTLLAILAGLLLCLSTCSPAYAQVKEPEMKWIEILTDGSHIIEIDGTQYRAIPAPKVRELVALREENNLLTAQIAEIKIKFDKYRATTEELMTSQKQSYLIKEDMLVKERDFLKSQFSAEEQLRKAYEQRIKSCGKKWFFGYRLCSY